MFLVSGDGEVGVLGGDEQVRQEGRVQIECTCSKSYGVRVDSSRNLIERAFKILKLIQVGVVHAIAEDECQ